MKKLIFLGAINHQKEPKGGEEYKNQTLLNEFVKYYQVQIIDTVHWKKNPTVWLKIIYLIFIRNFDELVISASSKSTYKFIKLLSQFDNKISKASYFVIGGYFPSAIVDNTFKSKYYSKIKAIIVEGESLKDKFIDIPSLFPKTHVIPNFKFFDKNIKFVKKKESVINFVFISRINKEKGVDIILEAVKNLNKRYNTKNTFNVNFYGKIDSQYEKTFFNELSENTVYHGFLNIIKNPTASYKILSKNDCMLFPTKWIGEGFPGVIIDAFICNMPVIATDWNMNSELISEKNGILIEPQNISQLEIAMRRMIEDSEFRIKLAKESEMSAHNYHVDNVFPRILEVIG